MACLALKRWSRGAAALEQMFDSKMKTNRPPKGATVISYG